jgi:ubiquitin carboxyl-terminal hydrolase 22/27/51
MGCTVTVTLTPSLATTMNGIQGCPHIDAVVAAGDTAPGPLRKFKEVVAWEVRRLQGVKNSSATRKVSGVNQMAATDWLNFRCLSPPAVPANSLFTGPLSVCTVHTRVAGKAAMFRRISRNRSIRFVCPSYCHKVLSPHRHTGVDVKTGSVFCFVCRDFIYHAKIDELYLTSIVTAEEEQTRFHGRSFAGH